MARTEGKLPGDAKEREKQILAIDKRRAAYYKYYTGNEWTDAGNYDLCLNTNHLDYDLRKDYEVVPGDYSGENLIRKHICGEQPWSTWLFPAFLC